MEPLCSMQKLRHHSELFPVLYRSKQFCSQTRGSLQENTRLRTSLTYLKIVCLILCFRNSVY